MIGVAILERDPMVQAILADYIRKIEGFQVIGRAESLKELKKLYAAGGIQLVVGETALQDGNFADWIEYLRGQKKFLDFIIVTGDRSYITFLKLMQYGTIDYILKPFTYGRFREGLLRYRTFKEGITPDDVLDQERLDEFFFGDLSMNRPGSAKKEYAFSEHTYKRILEYTRENSDMSFTAGELAAVVKLSRITARRYLERMEKEQVLSVEVQYGKVGRPQNRYRYKGKE
ncbi:MAG: response regulator [Firmicutes bacterium]|nr:response regulator [Bacillota bacterium]